MLRVGIVAEGRSDWLVLEEVMKTVHPEIEFVRLQPDQTLFAGIGQGWKGVRAWCRENGHRLEVIMHGITGDPIQILVIHADCSMADEEEIHHPCPPAIDTAVALAEVVETKWLGCDPIPEFVVVATPAQSSDAWVVATLDPPYANLADIECDKSVEDELIKSQWGEIKRLRKRDGEVKKPTSAYRPFAERVGQKIELVCTHCPQAEVFRSNFRVAVARSLPTQAP
jgi:hypothetical protein